MFDEYYYYCNYFGMGNIFNVNYLVVCCFICDCLWYWVDEMYVDGFCFDFVFILFRDEVGWLV